MNDAAARKVHPLVELDYRVRLRAYLSVGGIRFSLQAMAVLCVASALTVWIGGLRPTAASSPLTMGIGIAALLVYMSLFGLATNRQARHIVQNTRTIARQKEEMEAFAEVTAAISASLELTQVVDTIVRRAVTLSRADAGAIFEFDPTTGAFVAVASHNLTPAF